MTKRYYIAYGSNLNIDQMSYRCPGAKVVGTSEIPDFQLLFKGSKSGAYLTIEPKKGAKVPVAVWEVTADDELSLDRYEGCPNFYYKTEVEIPVIGISDRKVRKLKAFIYIMHEEREIGVPSQRYVDICLDGYDSFGFDENHLYEALNISLEEAGMTETKVCPICGKAYTGHPALSRKDDNTPICPDCGTRESLEAIGISPEEQEKVLEIIHEKLGKKPCN